MSCSSLLLYKITFVEEKGQLVNIELNSNANPLLNQVQTEFILHLNSLWRNWI